MLYMVFVHFLQCCDAVGWAAGRHSACENFSGEVLAIGSLVCLGVPRSVQLFVPDVDYFISRVYHLCGEVLVSQFPLGFFLHLCQMRTFGVTDYGFFLKPGCPSCHQNKAVICIWSS